MDLQGQKMKKHWMFVGLLALPTLGFAEYQGGMGIGLQYGGFGYQASLVSEQAKFFLSVGVISASIGVQKTLGVDRQHSLGLNLGSATFGEDFAGLTYNYYSHGVTERGTVVGIEIGRLKFEDRFLSSETIADFVVLSEKDDPNSNYLFVNLAVQF